MEAWLRSRERLEETRAHLKAQDLTLPQKKALECFERTFSTYLLDSAEATATREAITAAESSLEAAPRQRIRRRDADAQGQVLALCQYATDGSTMLAPMSPGTGKGLSGRWRPF